MRRSEEQTRSLLIKRRVPLNRYLLILPTARREIVSLRMRLGHKGRDLIGDETYYRATATVRVDGLVLAQLNGAALVSQVYMGVDRMLVEPSFGLSVEFATRQPSADDDAHFVEVEIAMRSLRKSRS